MIINFFMIYILYIMYIIYCHLFLAYSNLHVWTNKYAEFFLLRFCTRTNPATPLLTISKHAVVFPDFSRANFKCLRKEVIVAVFLHFRESFYAPSGHFK